MSGELSNSRRMRRATSRRRYLAAAGAAGIGSMAGCLGFLIAEDGDVELTDQQTVAVGPSREDDFDPQLVHLEEGGSVTFEWESGNHDVTSFHLENDVPIGTPEGTMPFSQDLNGPGQSLVVDFEEPGVYNVVCVRHERVGMMMSILVGEPDDLDDQPGMADPDPGLSDATQDRWRDLNEQIRELLEE